MLMMIPSCQCRRFQIALKMCCINNHNNVTKKFKKMTGIYQNKTELEKDIKIKKQCRVCWD